MAKRVPIMGIYTITHGASGRTYVGSSTDIHERWVEHRRALRNGTHHSRFLQRCYDQYGADALVWRVVEEVGDASRLLAREQWHMDMLAPVFNTSKKAGSQLGMRHSEATKAKMRAAKAKYKGNPSEAQRAYWQSLKGKPISPEHQQALLAGAMSKPRTAAQLEGLKCGPKRNHEQPSEKLLMAVRRNLDAAHAAKRAATATPSADHHAPTA